MITIRIDAREIERVGNLIGAAGKQAPVAIARALNHTGLKARTQMVRVLAKQTGLKVGVTRRALRQGRATRGNLAFVISSKGGFIALKHFAARETRKGASTAPRGQRRVFPKTFIKGGLFPRRVTLKLGGQVFLRVGWAQRLPIAKQVSDVRIPDEMITGASEQAFMTVAQRDLPARLAHELYRILPG